MVPLRQLSETPGNCFSCKKLRKFTIGGIFECNVRSPRSGDAILCDTNHPRYLNCEYWEQKTGCRVKYVKDWEYVDGVCQPNMVDKLVEICNY